MALIQNSRQIVDFEPLNSSVLTTTFIPNYSMRSSILVWIFFSLVRLIAVIYLLPPCALNPIEWANSNLYNFSRSTFMLYTKFIRQFHLFLVWKQTDTHTRTRIIYLNTKTPSLIEVMCHFTFMVHDNNQPTDRLTNLSAETDLYLFRSIHGSEWGTEDTFSTLNVACMKRQVKLFMAYNTLEIQSINGLSFLSSYWKVLFSSLLSCSVFWCVALFCFHFCFFYFNDILFVSNLC